MSVCSREDQSENGNVSADFILWEKSVQLKEKQQRGRNSQEQVGE